VLGCLILRGLFLSNEVLKLGLLLFGSSLALLGLGTNTLARRLANLRTSRDAGLFRSLRSLRWLRRGGCTRRIAIGSGKLASNLAIANLEVR
jgi:hypothetical protein